MHTYKHCRRWVALSHEATLASSMGKAHPGYRNRFIQCEHKDGIKAVTDITANEGFLKRAWNYVFYMLMILAIAPFLPRAYIVISTSRQFLNDLVGYFVARIKRCAWALEIRNLWPEAILAVGAIKNCQLKRDDITLLAGDGAQHLRFAAEATQRGLKKYKTAWAIFDRTVLAIALSICSLPQPPIH